MPRSVPRSERQVLGRVSQGVDMARRLEPSLRLVTHCKKVKQQALAHTLTHKHTFTHTHTHNQIHTFVHRQSQRPRRGGRDGGGGGAHGLDGAHLGRYQARTHPEPPALPLKTASRRIRMFLEYGVDMARSGGVMSMQGGGADNARLCSRTPRVWYRRVAGCTS